MPKLSKFILLFAVSCYALPAQAEIIVWQDPQTKMSASYPDSWRQQLNLKPDEVLRVMLPRVQDKAECRLRVRDEGRYRMYPKRYDDEIQRLGYGAGFWKEYIQENGEGQLFYSHNNKGFGRGHASIAEASYVPATGEKIEKRSIMMASLYADKVYIGECSSKTSAFEHWRGAFMSFFKSVDFRKVDHELVGGNYTDLHAEKIRIHGPTPKDDVVY